MNDRQNAKLNMAQRVCETLKRYETIYSAITPMLQAVETLNSNIANIRKAQVEQGAVSITASSLEKRAAKKQMIESAAKIVNILHVIGFTNKINSLISLQNFSERSFYSLTDNNTLALARRIYDLANKYATELSDYTIDSAEIEALDIATKNYNNLIVKPMAAIGKRKQKTENLKQMFTLLDATFRNRLDKLMVLFKKTNPEFYNEYRTARNIIFNVERKSTRTSPPDTEQSDHTINNPSII